MNKAAKPLTTPTVSGHSKPVHKATGTGISTGYRNDGSHFTSILRVSKVFPCPICGKTDWCGVSDNYEVAFCYRVEEGNFKVTANGGFMHWLSESSESRPVQFAAVSNQHRTEPRTRPSDINKSHAVYSEMLSMTELNERHTRELLENRLLGDTTIAYNLYASTDVEPSVIDTLRTKFDDDLSGVPGFYQDGSGMWVMKYCPQGFFVPVRDIKGRIAGLQIRLDKPSCSKYIWLSGAPAGAAGGTSSGTPAHFVKPDLVRQTKTVLLTEGPLKADSISELTGEPCIAVPGVTSVNPGRLASDLKREFSMPLTIQMAFDADWIEKRLVRQALLSFTDEFERVGFVVDVAQWDIQHGKGLDDALRNERIAEVTNNGQ